MALISGATSRCRRHARFAAAHLGSRDLLFISALRRGADGALTGFANFAPQFCVDLYKVVKACDLDRARRLHEINWAPEAAIYKVPNVYKHSRYKVAAYFAGLLDNMIVRAPQVSVPQVEVKLIHDAMETWGC